MNTKFIEKEEKIIIEKNGKKIDCDLLFTLESKENDKIYIGYTDNSIAPNGRKNIYVGAYDRFFGNTTVEEIKTEEEMKMIQDALNKINENINA